MKLKKYTAFQKLLHYKFTLELEISHYNVGINNNYSFFLICLGLTFNPMSF